MARSITVALELDDRGFNRGINSAERNVQGFDRSTRSAKVGLGTLAAGFAAATTAAVGLASSLSVASQVENLGVTLKLLYGDAERAADALNIVKNQAAGLSVSLGDIQGGVPSLALVEEKFGGLGNAIQFTAGLAQGFGMSFQDAASNVQRALGAGIASADMFRDSGVKAFLGFQEGVEYTAEQTQAVFLSMFDEVTAANADAAQTMSGQFSMVQDAVFQVQEALGSAFGETIKELLTDFNAVFAENKETILETARAIGEDLGNALKFLVENMNIIVPLVGAFVAGWAAFKVAALVQGILAIRGAVVALNLAIMANPIGALAAAIAAAATLIVVYFDDIKDAATTAALMTERAWLELKIFLLDVFGPTLDWVGGKFRDLQTNALATIAGISAAMEGDLLDSMDNFSAAFDETKARLNAADDATRGFANEVSEANARIEEINGALSENAENTADVEAAAEDAAAAVNKHKTANQAALPAMADMATASDEVCKAARKEANCVSAATEALNKKTKAEERAAAQAQRVISGSSGRLAGQVKELENQRELLDYYGEERQVKESLNRIERDRAAAIARIEALEDYPQKAEDLKKVNEQFDAQLQKVEDLEREIYDYQRTFEYGFKEAFNKFKEDSTNAATLAGDLFESAATDWRNAWVEAANTGKLSFDDLLGNMKNRIVAFLADAAFVKLTEVLAGAFGIDLGGKTAGSGASSGGSGGSGSSSSGGSGNIIDKAVDFVKGLFGFEKGGYVAGNRSVIVGEKGPEVFTPSGSGTIIPNFAGMQGSGQTVVYNINAVDSKSFVTMLTKHPDVIHGMVSARNAQMMGGRF